ncbi:MAG: DUF4912 domain-containing protein [Elainella sp. Prado103]|nr:DUF4912 domain-containing protein [Elainella sp. Prado103]
MVGINQSLKQRFEQQYEGSIVELATRGTDVAIQAVLAGSIDLAAIGRPLTEAERAQGLVEAPVSREKIAIFVGADNPFQENLTFEQFAGIFRGEIVNWAELGGAAAPIRFIDRPETSDTRQSLSRYSVFQSAPFQVGASAVQLPSDDTAAIVSQLGQDGISYGIVSQVLNRSDIRILPMHDTLPDDPRYPYSQPRNYVYRETNPAVRSFLGLIASPIGQQAIAEARQAEATAVQPVSPTPVSPSPISETLATPIAPEGSTLSPTPATSITPAAQPSRQDVGWLPWLLLPLAGVGGLLLWGLNRRRESTIPLSGSDSSVATATATSSLAERSGTVITGDQSTSLERSANSMDQTASVSIEPLPEEPLPEEPLPESAISADRSTVEPSVEPSASVTPTSAIDAGRAMSVGVGAAALAGGIGARLATSEAGHRSQIILTPRTSTQGYAYWEVPEAERARLKQQGGEQLTLRILDTTDIDLSTDQPPYSQQYPCAEPDRDAFVALPIANREYVAELGYLTANQQWLLLARSTPVYVAGLPEPLDRNQPARSASVDSPGDSAPLSDQLPEASDSALQVSPAASTAELHSELSTPDLEAPERQPSNSPDVASNLLSSDVSGGDSDSRALLMGGTSLIASTGALTEALQNPPVGEAIQAAVEASRFDLGSTDEDLALAAIDEGLAELPSGYDGSWITLLARDPYWAYTYWNTPEADKQRLRQHGGQRLALRFYDVTAIDLKEQNPHSLQQYECDEIARDWYLPIPVSDRDYIVEIGYVTSDGHWLMLARSNAICTPPLQPSDWSEAQFLTVSWDKELTHDSLVELTPLGQQSADRLAERILDLSNSTQLAHLAGSLFGSQHQIPSASLSSFGLGSGAGLVTRTESGVGIMSGIGMMSGVGISGMSGVGLYSMSGVGISGMSGVGLYSMSGVGMTVPAVPTFSGIGLGSGMGMMSGVGMYSMSGVGMLGMSGVGMYSMSGIGLAASMPPLRSRQFWLLADAELIVYGATEPGAKVTIAGYPVQLNPDGTFRLHLSFQDGMLDFPILAIAEDGEQSRSVHLRFNRETPSRHTNPKDEARDELF